MSFLKEVFRFGSSPSLFQKREYAAAAKSFKFVVVGLLVVMFSNLFFRFITQSLLINGHAVPANKLTGASGNLVAIGIIIFYIPIVEELAFRLCLRLSRLNFAISLSLVVALVIKIFMGPFFIEPHKEHQLLTFILFDFLAFTFFFNVNYFVIWMQVEKYLVHVYTNSFGSIMYSLLAIFSLLHLNNFELSLLSFNTVLYIIVFIGSQFFRGFILSFIALRCGIGWSILLHILINSLVLLR
jgi:hypothetical protein